MKYAPFVCVVLGLFAGTAPAGRAQQKQPPMEAKVSPVPQTQEWQAITSLAGNWEGFAEAEAQKMPVTVEARMTGDGSALMHILGKDTPHEMVTMFHPDGKRLLATHYCAAHNQPRMVLVPGAAPNQLAFEFVDGTNIEPGGGHMQKLVITFVDADHHDETWTYRQNGTDLPGTVFHFARVK